MRHGLIEMGETKWHSWVYDIMKDKEPRTAKHIQEMIMEKGYKLTPSPTKIAMYLSRNDKYVSHEKIRVYNRGDLINLWKMIE